MSRKPLIYCAGPYRHPDQGANVHNAIVVGGIIRDKLRATPIIPHLSLQEQVVKPRDDSYWLAATMELLEHCHAMYRMHGYSEGSDAEEARANELGIPVFRELGKLSEWVDQWSKTYAAEQLGVDDASGTAGVENHERR